MKPIILFLLLFTLLYLVADFFVKESSFGLFPTQINATLFGDEESFMDPINVSIFLEFIHAEIFFIMMLLLTLSAIYGRVGAKNLQTLVIVNLTMIASLVSLISLFLSFYFSIYSFVYIYFTSFFIWHLLAMYMVLHSLWKLNAKSI